MNPKETQPTRPATRRAAIFALVLLAAAVVLAIVGILPRIHARAALRSSTNSMALPTVEVIHPRSGAPAQQLVLPGTILAYHDAPIYARTSGYVRSWSHDIGSHVRPGELLAVISTPELDRQVDQARAALANSTANLGLSEITAQRYESLRGTEAVSQQSIDTAADTEKAQRASVAVARQNLNQLLAMQSFERVTAPFAGTVTARNVDTGQLVEAGSNGGTGSLSATAAGASASNSSSPQELFRISDTRIVRVYIDVPGIYVPDARPGAPADIGVSSYPGRVFQGKIVRTANALDLNTRTLRAEVDIDNRNGVLLPGDYAQVHLKLNMQHPALVIPVGAMLFRSEGLRVVTVAADNRAHLVPITTGRDWGTEIEVLTGLTAGDRLVPSPPDSIVEGEKVNVVGNSNPGGQS